MDIGGTSSFDQRVKDTEPSFSKKLGFGNIEKAVQSFEEKLTEKQPTKSSFMSANNKYEYSS